MSRQIYLSSFITITDCLLIVKHMIFQKNNDELDWNQADDAASHVDNWNRVEARIAYFCESLNKADTLNNLNFLRILI